MTAPTPRDLESLITNSSSTESKQALPIYRPILVAKRGELTALGAVSAAQWPSLMPVLQVPPREWDFDRSVYKKSMEDHLQDMPKKIATATKRNRAFIDVSLIDNVLPIFGGQHPLAWLIDEADRAGVELTPYVTPGSAATTMEAAINVHARTSRGVGLRLPTDEWITVDPTRLPRILAGLGMTASDIDLFVDAGREFGSLVRASAVTELTAQEATYAFRSRTLGGAAFPDTQGLARGLSEFTREDWLLFRDVYRTRRDGGFSEIDFFDNAVNNPASDVGLIDPRLLSISALFRYSIDEQWLVVKGGLFKGSGGRGTGAAAMVDPLALLVAHAKYGVPIRTVTDVWIDSVVAGTQNGGNAEAWRKWATQRHLLVVGHQLASPI